MDSICEPTRPPTLYSTDLQLNGGPAAVNPSRPIPFRPIPSHPVPYRPVFLSILYCSIISYRVLFHPIPSHLIRSHHTQSRYFTSHHIIIHIIPNHITSPPVQTFPVSSHPVSLSCFRSLFPSPTSHFPFPDRFRSGDEHGVCISQGCGGRGSPHQTPAPSAGQPPTRAHAIPTRRIV